MAVTVDYSTLVITIPKADTILVAAGPPEVRSLDLEALRLELRALEASVEGMPEPIMLQRQPTSLLAGVTYAQQLRIVNYTVTLEDGNYRVDPFGANHNLGDVLNLNNVQLVTNNSGGLIVFGSDAGTVPDQVVNLRMRDGVRLGFPISKNGIIRTGLVSGDAVITVSNPARDTVLTPSMFENPMKPGEYYFDVPDTFFIANGAGDYSYTIEISANAPKLNAVGGGTLKGTKEGYDSLAAAVWNATQKSYSEDGTMGGSMLAASAQGLQHSYEDETVFAGPNGELTSSRRRVFASEAELLAATDGAAAWSQGEQAIYQNVATYVGGTLQTMALRRVAKTWADIVTLGLLLDGDDASAGLPIDRGPNALGIFAAVGGTPATYTPPSGGNPGFWTFSNTDGGHFSATLAGTDIVGPSSVLMLIRPTVVDTPGYVMDFGLQPIIYASEITGFAGRQYLRPQPTGAHVFTPKDHGNGVWSLMLWGIDGAGTGQAWELSSGTTGNTTMTSPIVDAMNLSSFSTLGARASDGRTFDGDIAQVAFCDGEDGSDPDFRADLLATARARWPALSL